MAVVAAEPKMRERLPARAPSVPPMRRAVGEFATRCGASAPQLSAIALGVSEAVSNAVVHAYVGQDVGIVEVDAQLCERILQVTVRDEGLGLRPRTDSPGAGLGLGLIASLIDSLDVADMQPGVQVRMTFSIG